MFFHVILTTQCNLQCRYCFGEAEDDFDADFSGLRSGLFSAEKSSYTWHQLAQFCSKDAECVLTFYGGEPLLCTNEIKADYGCGEAEALHDPNEWLIAG